MTKQDRLASAATAPSVLPVPRPVLWPLRPRSSARVSQTQGRDVSSVRIDHAPLAGVTSQMLEWWYGNVPGTMLYAGEIYPRYLVWHPLDHISYEVVGAPATVGDEPRAAAPVRTGSHLRIREALHRDVDQIIDIRVTVEELTHGRAVIVKRVLGTAVIRLENDFADSPAGATYRTTLTIGDTTVLGRLVLNRVAHHRAFPPERIQPWIRHHIEEIGNLENFLPQLYSDVHR